MPHYLVEAAATEDEPGPRIRAFLDTFNHRLYSLLYQAWRIQDGVGGSRHNAYTALAQALAGGHEDARLAHAGGLTRNGASPALMSAALTAELDLPVTVTDGIPQWLRVPDQPVLGGGASAPCLGNDALLGERIQVAGDGIDVHIGPIDLDTAMSLLPGGKAGDQVMDLVPKLAGVSISFDMVLNVAPEGGHELALGRDELPLGWRSWLGASPNETNTIRITAGRRAATTN
jgi:type VI secretion system protein ImpH